MPFKNRQVAGKELARALQQHAGKDGVVLGIPRGGVATAFEVACSLDMPLDVVLAKKIPHPHQPELAIGAVSADGLYVDARYEFPDSYIHDQVSRLRELIRVREGNYHAQVAARSWKDRTVILVDDGIATGHTLTACIHIVHGQDPKEIIVAIPVAPKSTVQRISMLPEVNEVLVLNSPSLFMAIGHYYDDFSQVSDEEVSALLRRSSHEGTEV